MTFAEAIRDLPQAVGTIVAYQNPYTDEWVDTGWFNELVEPSRTLEQAREGDAETVPVVQRSHRLVAIINPVDVYGPLEEVLREETIDGTPLGDVMFGEFRRYRGGGDLVGRLTGAADELGVTVRIVSESEWTHGEAKGICE